MRFHRELPMSPEEVRKCIRNYCHCNVLPFRITQMSFRRPKGYGLFYATKGNYLFFSIRIKRWWGYNASKRHLMICMKGDSNHCSLYGSLRFSDYFFYLTVVLIVCMISGVKTRFAYPLYYVYYIVAYMSFWFLQSLTGILVFREDEKLLLKEVNMLLDKIAESKTEQKEESLRYSKTEDK